MLHLITCHGRIMPRLAELLFYFKLWQPFCSAVQNHFSNFGKRALEEHFCEIILKSGHWHGRCHLKFFLFLALVAWEEISFKSFLAILVEGHSRNIPVKLFQNPLTRLEDVS